MISLINKSLIKLVPHLPISFIKIFSNRYIAGTSPDQALEIVRQINNKGMSATIDILGEHTKTQNECKDITFNYIDLYKRIKKQNLDCNISLKPSHIGSDINIDFFEKNLTLIHNQASKNNNFLRIDMENNKLTDITISAFYKEYNSAKNIGIVIQAYLYRSENDINKLPKKSNIRLCKGIYNESAKIAIKNPEEINTNYIKLLKKSFKKQLYVGIATHDTKLIHKALKIIEDEKIDKNQFEFQILYGVPMDNILNKILNIGYKVRVYIPYGIDWYKYSIRRLNENPNISGYIIKNFFKKNFY